MIIVVRFVLSLFFIHFFIFSTSSQPVDSLVIDSLNKQSRSFWRSNPDSARTLAQQAYDLSMKSGYKKGQLSALNNFGAHAFLAGNYKEALNYWQEALTLSRTLSDSTQIAKILGNVGLVYEKQELFPEAIKYNFEALDIKNRLKDSTDIALTYNNIGNIYIAVSDYQKALYYHEKALAIRLKYDSSRLSSTYMNLGEVYVLQNQLDSAYTFLRKSLELKIKENDLWGIAANYSSLGQLFIDKQAYDSALIYLKKSEEMAEKVSAENLKWNAIFDQSQIYFKKAEYNKALNLLEKLEKNHVNLELNLKVKSLHLLALIHFMSGQREQAAGYFYRHSQLRDSLDEIRNAQITAEVQAKYFYDQREKELMNQQATKEAVLKSKIEGEQQVRTILIIAVASALLALLIIVRTNYIVRKKNKKLKEQQNRINDLLRKQEEIIEMKTSELLASQNTIMRYAFLNAHELRAPLARILGIIQVASQQGIEKDDMLERLLTCAEELDAAVKKISKELNRD